MASDDKQKSLPRRCQYCNARFNDDLREHLEEDDEPVYCELCGAEVRIHSTQESQPHKKGIKKKQKKNSKKKRKKEPQHLNPITHIGFDPEFPLIFKENLMLVLSRITFLAIKKVDNIEALKNSNRDISKELLDQLEHILEPTTWAKIKINFLGKLHKLTIDQFYEHLKRLQKKIRENEQYHEHFIIFLRYIINNTFRIVSEMWDTPEIPKFFHVIRKDLKEYGFDTYTMEENGKNEGNREASDESNENEEVIINEIGEFQDIFTRDIADDDPLWRVRAYVIGLLLADGFIQKRKSKEQRKYRIIFKQHKRDFDLLKIVQKSLGGEIRPLKKNIYSIEISNKELVLKLIEYGMVEGHSKEKNAIIMEPPKFIKHIINGHSLVHDFTRGFYDGDGWFTGTSQESNASFQINGPFNFLNMLKEIINIEVDGLSSTIYDEKINLFKYKGNEYRLYSGFRIYIPKKGFYRLKTIEINKGTIERRSHPWLKVLSITGTFNVIKFFNWFYENNDDFHEFEIESIRISGKRKFLKALNGIGDSIYRKEKISPSLIDIIPEVLLNLEPRFYNLGELSKLFHKKLKKTLDEMNLNHLFNRKKSRSIHNLRERMKLLEYRDEIIVSYQKRVGRSNINYYFNPFNPPNDISSEYKKKIYLKNRNGEVRNNLKNFVLRLFLDLENKPLSFKQIKNNLIKTKFCVTKNIRPFRIKFEFLELKYFGFFISNNTKIEFSRQKFILNLKRLCNYFNDDIDNIKYKMNEVYK